ncbi:ABC transporter ATP-binding protein [Putridiphycobacter roseus]|nr:ABC transporter ATP-binding protein [Putridiphycobacter roseus]
MPAPSWINREDIMGYFGDKYDYEMGQFIIEYGKIGALAFICVSVLIAFFLKNLFRYGAVYHQSYMRMAVVRDLRYNLFKKAICLPIAYHTDERKGNLLSRMTSDLNEVEIAVVYLLEIIFREPIAVVISLGFLFYVSVPLTLFSLILLPISGFLISKIGKSLKRTSVQGQEKMGTLLSLIEEAIGGVRIIKAFTAENTILKRFTKENNKHQELTTSAFRKKDLASPLNEFLGAAIMVGIVWYGGSLILEDKGTLNGEQFMGFIIVFSQLLRPISGIANGLTSFKKAEASLERIDEVLDIKDTILPAKNPIEKTTFESEIVFNKVNFSYKETQVLKNISFELKKGKTIALVGESGSGKSTISDLIPRFYDINSGEILIDGINIKDISIPQLRNLISIVSQESVLFNDTIANNISFGKPDATSAEIEAAAKIANAHEFIKDLEHGYATTIGDRGNKLSGGQKQRISIARAVLADSPIMIFDEATSALDTESEKVVQKALDNLMSNRTSLVIAHRLSTIRNADQIIVLKQGEIVESGNHDQLIAEKGYYYSLCQIQQLV